MDRKKQQIDSYCPDAGFTKLYSNMKDYLFILVQIKRMLSVNTSHSVLNLFANGI